MARAQLLLLFVAAGSFAACADPEESDAGPDTGVDSGSPIADSGADVGVTTDVGASDLGPGQDASPDADASPDPDASDPDATPGLDASPDPDATPGQDVAPADTGASILHATCDAPITIDSAPLHASQPRISSTAAGQVAIAWQEQDVAMGLFRGMVRLYLNDAFVGPPHALDEPVVSSAEVAFDGANNAHARWANFPAVRERAEYDATTDTWGPADIALDNPASDLTISQSALASNTAGAAFQVFYWNENTQTTIGAAAFDPLTRVWGGIEILEQEPLSGGFGPQLPRVAVNEAGQAVAIWVSEDSSIPQTNLTAAGFVGGAWTTPVPLQVISGTPNDLVVLSTGEAVVTYYGGSNNLLARHFDPLAPVGSEWGPEEIVEDNNLTIGQPEMFVDDDDNLTVLWKRSNADIAVSVRNFGGAWTTPVDVGPTTVPPSAAIDKDGNISAVVQRDSQPIYLYRMEKLGTTWTPRVDVSSVDPGFSGPVRVGHDTLGNPVIAYQNLSMTPQGNRIHIHWTVCR